MQKRKEADYSLHRHNLFPRNRKASHVGMILSFVVFITALIFIYTIIEPAVNTSKDKQSVLKNLEIQLTDKFSSRLTTSVIANDSNSDIYDCIKINNTQIDTAGLNAIVKNKTDAIINSQPEGGNFLKIDWAGNETSFKIYYSEEKLEEHNLTRSCINVTTMYYQGLVTWKKQIFASKIIKTIGEYQDNYNSIKTQLEVPSDSEFSFSFKMENGTEIKTPEANVSASVYSGEFPIQYLDKTASIKFGVLKIKVW